jgi:hypothetical protein
MSRIRRNGKWEMTNDKWKINPTIYLAVLLFAVCFASTSKRPAFKAGLRKTQNLFAAANHLFEANEECY